MRKPNLRFAGFEDEWKESEIKNVLRKISRPVKVASTSEYRQIGIRSHGNGIFHKAQVTGAALGDKRVFWVEPNALVVNIVFAWEQAVAVTTEREKGMVASHRFPMYVAKESRAEPEFVLRLFLTGKGKKLLELASPGGAGRNKTLGQKEFESLKIVLPPPPEQRKVAQFLSVLDQRTTELRRKLELLEAYAGEMARRIFAREVRLTDEAGNDFPEWERRKFGDVFDFYGNNSFSRDCLTYESGSVRHIHYGDIHSNYRSALRIERENVPFVRPEFDVSRVPPENYCREGDLVIADASEDYDDVGKSIEILNLSGEQVLAGLHTFIARDRDAAFANGFKGYLMRSESVRCQIKTLATGVSVLGISKSNLAKVDLCIPSRDEQVRIACFLGAIDDKIFAIKEQLRNLARYKQGLLSEMFV